MEFRALPVDDEAGSTASCSTLSSAPFSSTGDLLSANALRAPSLLDVMPTLTSSWSALCTAAAIAEGKVSSIVAVASDTSSADEEYAFGAGGEANVTLTLVGAPAVGGLNAMAVLASGAGTTVKAVKSESAAAAAAAVAVTATLVSMS